MAESNTVGVIAGIAVIAAVAVGGYILLKPKAGSQASLGAGGGGSYPKEVVVITNPVQTPVIPAKPTLPPRIVAPLLASTTPVSVPSGNDASFEGKNFL